MAHTSISKTIHSKAPKVPFTLIADAILPSDYDLSLVLIADTLGKKLNQEHKGRNYPTNILSFPLSPDAGEIFINVRRTQREAHKFNHSTTKHITYLFIHGCLHLCGYKHGDKMELLEQKYLKKFSQ
jgi:probable rRNA maturation factor